MWKAIANIVLALMCSIMFLEKSDEVEKYVGGLPDMIHESIHTLAKKQPKNKRIEDTLRNNQNQQQQPFKRHNVAWAYTTGLGEKKPYGGSKPLCPKCNYHHDGQCDPKCINCKRTGHSARDCRSQLVATNNKHRAQGGNQRVLTYFECVAQGHFKNNCPKLRNKNQGNHAENDNGLGSAWTNLKSNVVMG
nr:hypothetical protein [Tanacetum cinerariifolium]